MLQNTGWVSLLKSREMHPNKSDMFSSNFTNIVQIEGQRPIRPDVLTFWPANTLTTGFWHNLSIVLNSFSLRIILKKHSHLIVRIPVSYISPFTAL